MRATGILASTPVTPRADALEQLLGDLGRSKNAGHLEALVAIGKSIVDALFGGDPNGWRNGGRRDPNYLRLERHPNLPISHTKLYLSLRVYELCNQHSFVLDCPQLTLTHIVSVLPLQPEDQRRLLTQASAERWTIRRLQREVARASTQAPRTGRPRTPPVVKTLRRTLATDDAFDGADALLGLAPPTARELLDACTRIEQELAVVRRNLEAAASNRPMTRILLVHPSRPYGLRVQRELRAHGYSTCLANSCSEARTRTALQPACAVIDVVQTDGDGSALAQELESYGLPCILIGTPDTQNFSGVATETPIVETVSGLLPLRVALAKTVGVDPPGRSLLRYQASDSK